MVSKFIVGEESLDNFDAFVAGCKSRGLDRYLQIYQRHMIADRNSNNQSDIARRTACPGRAAGIVACGTGGNRYGSLQ
jgi:hypothetical protein